jgi:hypothetical protein
MTKLWVNTPTIWNRADERYAPENRHRPKDVAPAGEVADSESRHEIHGMPRGS